GGGSVRQEGRAASPRRGGVPGLAGAGPGGCGHPGGFRGSAAARTDLTRLTLGISAPGLLVAAWIGAQGGEAPRTTLLWGGDGEGGAAFVEADPADASEVRGFDGEVAETIARGVGLPARLPE